jgi:hypothetical protein
MAAMSESARMCGFGVCTGGSSQQHVGARGCTTRRMHERPARARRLSDTQPPTVATRMARSSKRAAVSTRSSDQMGPISTQKSLARSTSFCRMI